MIWNILPNDILIHIKSFIRKDVMYLVTKEDYINNYTIEGRLLRRVVLKSIRNDYWFIYKILLEKHYPSWIKIRRYVYQGVKYKHFIDFLSKRIIEEQANKCKIVMSEYK